MGRLQNRLLRVCAWCAFAVLSVAILIPTGRGNDTTVAVLTIKGAIGPATADYLKRGIDEAAASGAQAVVIEIDTPGGLDLATRDINQAILAAPLPVIMYVHPEGARAASAGTYLLYASHIAAMAPATNLGAATPVSIGGFAPPPAPEPAPEPAKDSESGADADEEDPDTADPPVARQPPASAMERKVVNDAVAYIRGLAEKRGRNADWAEAAVRDAVSLSANDALAENVIDLIAGSLGDLLNQVDGREVVLADGTTRTLTTAGATIQRIEPDWRNRLLAKITDPTVAYLLFIIGIYGLLLEGYSPGALVPGIVGGICLLLALYAFQVLPINYVGLGLILLGVVLIVAETLAPSFGTLGIGGIIALTLGSVILMDTDIEGLQVSRGVIASIAALAGIGLLWLVTALVKIRRRPPVSGTGALVGARGQVIDASGRVHVAGEDWAAESAEPLAPGDNVEILAVEGLSLRVRKT